MKSCLCDRSQAVDNYYSGTSDTYRGPYAFADTDSYGYNCSLGRYAKMLLDQGLQTVTNNARAYKTDPTNVF